MKSTRIGILVLALIAAGPALAGDQPPYSCRLYYEAERNCQAFGNCDQRTQERLKRECYRDGGRP